MAGWRAKIRQTPPHGPWRRQRRNKLRKQHGRRKRRAGQLCPRRPKKINVSRRAELYDGATVHEMNLMCIYQSDSRSGLIAALTEMRGYLDEDEAELRELTDSTLQKLGEITDEDFAALELVPDFDTDE